MVKWIAYLFTCHWARALGQTLCGAQNGHGCYLHKAQGQAYFTGQIRCAYVHAWAQLSWVGGLCSGPLCPCSLAKQEKRHPLLILLYMNRILKLNSFSITNAYTRLGRWWILHKLLMHECWMLNDWGNRKWVWEMRGITHCPLETTLNLELSN